MRAGRPLALADTSMQAYAIDTDAPLMALVGVLRPRLLITRPVLEALTDEELRASVAHELGHWRAWDNLKRLAMHAAPDLLSATGAARALDGDGRRPQDTSPISARAMAATPAAPRIGAGQGGAPDAPSADRRAHQRAGRRRRYRRESTGCSTTPRRALDTVRFIGWRSRFRWPSSLLAIRRSSASCTA
jgi:hypothetical protein